MLDLRLASALQVDGRASFTRIAEVLGVSDQTVARRYARLRAAGTLRVVGLADPEALGYQQWHVRMTATPDAAQGIARSLTRRADTSWVMLLAGGTEIVCTVTSAPDDHGEDLLLSALPRTARVLTVQAHCRLHQFYGGREGLMGKLGLLGPDEVAALQEGAIQQAHGPGTVDLDGIDSMLLGQLAVDGRVSVERLAVAAATPAETVRRRLQSLRERGVLYFDVDLDNRVLGRGVEAVLWLSVEPARIHETGVALAAHPEMAFVAAYTGPRPLLAYVLTPDPRSLYTYLTTSIATLAGVREVESAMVIRLLKGPGAVVPA